MEVTGRKLNLDISCQGSNEDDEDMYCDPCENEGEKQTAEGFCVDCQEYLCSSCFKMHRRPIPWRHHVLQDKDAMPKTKRKEQLNYECTEPCTQHSTKIIEYYCQTHDQLGCPVCITENHRTCNDVDYIPRIAGQYKESSEINEIFKSLEGLQEKTDEYTAAANENKFKVATQEQKAKAHVLQLREEFNSICNRLEDDIDTVKESDETKIESCIKTFTDISKKIKTRVAVMEKKQTEMKVSQLYTETKLAKFSVEELTKEMASARDNAKIRHYKIDFNVEELREGLKLRFHDNRREDDISELNVHNPQNSKNELAQNLSRPETTESDSEANVDNISMLLDDIMKLQSNQTANTGEWVKGNKPNAKDLYTKGTRKYDREFLLQFRYCPYAMHKPEHLTDIPDIVLDKPNEESSHESDFKSKYVWTAASACKKQTKSKVTNSDTTSTQGKSDDDLVEQLQENVSQPKPQQTLGHGISPTVSSQQNIGFPPPLIPNFQVPLAYPQPPPIPQPFTYPGHQNIVNTNMQGVPYTHIPYTPPSSGFSYSPPRPPQLSAFPSYPFGFGSGKQPLLTTQQSPPVQAGGKPILSIFDIDISKIDVNPKVCKKPDGQSQDPINKNKTANISKIGATLNDLIVKKKKDNEDVIEWIDNNVDAAFRKQPRFIRALMTVVCNSAVKGNKGYEKLVPMEIRTRDEILKRYLNKESELELQALYAVQAFITQLGHPKGILRRLFDTLYDEGLVSENAFLQWEVSTDEPEGKEVCLKQTVQFFLRWLRDLDKKN